MYLLLFTLATIDHVGESWVRDLNFYDIKITECLEKVVQQDKMPMPTDVL